MEYWAAKPDNVTVRLGDAVLIDAPLARRRIPIDDRGEYVINYRRGARDVVQRGYSRLLVELARRYEKKEPVGITGITGRILLVGQMAEGLTDFGPTPLSSLTPLVLVHANVIENVLREDYVRIFPSWIVWAVVLGVSVGGLARFSQRRPSEQAFFAIAMPVAFVAAATLAWIDGSWIIPIVGPVAGFVAVQIWMIGRRMIAEMRAKEQIKGMFGTYVSPELVTRLVAAGRPPELGGHEEEITAFFSDIEGFSSFSEVLSPSRLVELMNEYLTACTDIVQAEGGTLDKYIGDAIVAMYGAPVALPDHAYRACLSAVNVQQRVGELRAKWRADGTWPELVCRLRTRVGLNSGPCVIGNMGSRTRFNYTMMGDQVNLAARMESGAKHWGVYAMCTETTRQACIAYAADRIVFRPLGRIQVKGRSSAVPIYEIAGLKESLSPRALECFGMFSEALAAYHGRDWARAVAGFNASSRLEPLLEHESTGARHATPSEVYLEIVARLRETALPDDWTGVHVMAEK
jgi:adenylate cyclase